MIRKHADPRPLNTAIDKAGWNAEKQMAHYLDRAFKDRKDVHVFHDLRLEEKGDAAQIDHLVLDPYGFHIIESKSVTSSVRVNERDEWMREWNGSWQGMSSPLLQARRQGEFLCRVLTKYGQNLVWKLIDSIHFDYAEMRWLYWVAISDKGIIHQSIDPPHQEIRKADQITDAIVYEIERSRKARRILKPSLEMPTEFREETLARLSLWILNHHVPLVHEEPKSAIDPARLESFEPDAKRPAHANELPESKACRFCQTRNLKVAKGPYGLYFKCLDCGKNTPILFTCTPRCKPHLEEREGGYFFRVCPQCKTEKVYFKNP